MDEDLAVEKSHAFDRLFQEHAAILPVTKTGVIYAVQISWAKTGTHLHSACIILDVLRGIYLFFHPARSLGLIRRFLRPK